MIINLELQFFLEKYILKKFSLTCGNKHFGGILGGMLKIMHIKILMIKNT